MPRVRLTIFPLPEFFGDWKDWAHSLVEKRNDQSAPDVSPGMIIQWPLDTIPVGWLLCDGQTVKRDAYPNLFGIINTDYNTGGEGSDEFSVPSITSTLSAGGYVIRC